MEFFGDAILSTIVAEYLLKKYPYYQEGLLSKIRSYIVSCKSLQCAGDKLELQQFLDPEIAHTRNLGKYSEPYFLKEKKKRSKIFLAVLYFLTTLSKIVF